MQIITFGTPPRIGGVIGPERIVDLNLAYAAYSFFQEGKDLPYPVANAVLPASLLEFLTAGKDAIDAAKSALNYILRKDIQEGEEKEARGPNGERLVHHISELVLKPPLPDMSSRIFCAGGNFADHLQGINLHHGDKRTQEEIRSDVRSRPLWGFYKLPQTIMGTREQVVVPEWVRFLDYEVELVAYIGRQGKNVSVDEARNMIVGYSCFNDWSVRDRAVIIGSEQIDSGVQTFAFQKNAVGASLGPFLVIDEIDDPYSLTMETRVNGKLRQSGNTLGMIYSFEEIVSQISRYVRLLPGDLIASGTCAGTAFDSSSSNEAASNIGDSKLDLSLCLKEGDNVEASVSGVGTLQNKIHFEKK